MLRNVSTISEAFTQWQAECDDRFNQLKANEEELNRIFIDIYGLQDELTPEVEDKDVTVRKADLQRDIKSLLSYAVGCMFGRYSLDKPGLILQVETLILSIGNTRDRLHWMKMIAQLRVGMLVFRWQSTIIQSSTIPTIGKRQHGFPMSQM